MRMDEIIELLSPLAGKRVIAAMSGGVDSSVAAALLHKAGCEVVGVFMHLWDYPADGKRHGNCCALDDAYDARRVADRLGIPFYTLDLRKEFAQSVVNAFVRDYAEGRTPNPCAHCNRFVKFGALLTAADRIGAQFIATGHYLRRMPPWTSGSLHLLRGVDRVKDQSYFLATTRPEALARAIFPVGWLTKDETRAIARHFSLPTAQKAESQDVCFLPDGDRVQFLAARGGAGLERGEIVEAGTGRVLGQHEGIARYTIGQRRGLKLASGPWRVVGIDAERRRLIVAPAERAGMQRVRIHHACWFARLQGDFVEVQLRYRAKATPARIEAQEEDQIELVFEAPIEPTAPGQVAAFYDGERLLGGGVVARIWHAAEAMQAASA